MYEAGTKLYFVPIRYWEDTPIETGHVAEHSTFHGEWLPSWSPNHVYAFHDGYRHNVYMQRDRTCLNVQDAVNLKAKLAADYEAQQKVEFEAWWQRVEGSVGKK